MEKDNTVMIEDTQIDQDNNSTKSLFIVSYFKVLFCMVRRSFRWFFSDCFKKHSRRDLELSLLADVNLVKSRKHKYISPWIYQRFFLILLSTFILSTFFDNYLFSLIIGSALIPMTLLILTYEINLNRDVNLLIILICFLLGGYLSIVFVYIFRYFIGYDYGFNGDLLTGVIEEFSKLIILLIFVRLIKPKSMLSCMLIGFAIGAGFSCMESSNYALSSLFSYLVNPRGNINNVYSTIYIRSINSLFTGHHYWTGLMGGVCFSPFKINPVKKNIKYGKIVGMIITLILLHCMWNYSLSINPPFDYLIRIGIMITTMFLYLIYIWRGITDIKVKMLPQSKIDGFSLNL